MLLLQILIFVILACGLISIAGSEENTPTRTTSAGEELAYGFVSSTVWFKREMGLGDCGVDPWFTEGCLEIAPSKWWGQHLRIEAFTPVLIIPDGVNRWVITNQPETLSKYGFDQEKLIPRFAKYAEASIDFGVTPECSGQIEGNDFHFQVMCTYEDGEIELILSANPQEHIWGECAGVDFEQHPTHLLYAWGVALSGDPHDLTGVLHKRDRSKGNPSTYQHDFTTNTNPSPEERDLVKASLSLQCVEYITKGGSADNEKRSKTIPPTNCPWD